MVIWLLACVGGDEPIAHLPPERLLKRASYDTRQTLPTLDEWEALEEDPEVLDELIDGYIDDDRIGQAVTDFWAELYRTRIPAYGIDPEAFGIDDYIGFMRALGDEAPQVVGQIARMDYPWTELVTGDWTMVDEVLAQAWPTDYPEGGTGWQEVQYTDNRPEVGVLQTSSLWMTYPSTLANANRKRANATTRLFVCQDLLGRQIDFDRNANILSEDDVTSAIKSDPACANCHVVLDPLASFFYGFWVYNPENPQDVSTYHPERENVWRNMTGAAPSWYGEEGYALGDLGQLIAGDARFAPCAVEQAMGALLRRDVELSDATDMQIHEHAFVDGDLTMRALFRSIIESDAYRADATDDPLHTPLKMATPHQLARVVEDLTGFDWTADGGRLMHQEAAGFVTLAGGTDGFNVTQPALTPSTTVLLVQQRLAEAGAFYVAEHDSLGEEEPLLFDLIDFTETPDTAPDPMVEQLQALHLRLFGKRVEADDVEITETLALWQDLHAYSGDTARAWGGVLSALLRDPDILLY